MSERAHQQTTPNVQHVNPTFTPMENRLKLKKATSNNNSQIPYCQVIGKLLYIVIASRPNIGFLVSYLSCFVACYDESHWIAIKRLLCYLKGSCNLAVTYHHPTTVTQTDFIPVGYCDANWGGNPINCKSVSSYFFILARGPMIELTHQQA